MHVAQPDRIATLWVEWPLNNLADVCVRSWVRAGYEVDLYTYDEIGSFDAPFIPNVMIRNANEIWVPPFIHKHDRFDSLAPFADVFRHKLIAYRPEVTWLDADVFLTRRLPDAPNMFALQDANTVAGCLIRSRENKTVRDRLFDLGRRCETTYHVLPWGASGMLWYGQIISDQADVEVLRPQQLHPVPADRKHELWMKNGRDLSEIRDLLNGIHFFNAANRGAQPVRNSRSLFDQCAGMVGV